jgi:hypothetical protein
MEPCWTGESRNGLLKRRKRAENLMKMLDRRGHDRAAGWEKAG